MKHAATHKLPFGFSLVENLISWAMLAIIVVALCPSVTQQVRHARTRATARELENIQSALLAYYADMGAFPAEEVGLTALIDDPGDARWRGPYLDAGSRDPARAVATDGFGTPYIYDVAPDTNPHGVADVLVISHGANGEPDLATDGIWLLSRIRGTDDLAVTVSERLFEKARANRHRLRLEAMARGAGGTDADAAGFVASRTPRREEPPRSGPRSKSMLRDLYRSRLEQAGMSPVELSRNLDTADAPTPAAPREGEGRGRIKLRLEPAASTRLALGYMQKLIDMDADLPLSDVWSGDKGMRRRLGLGDEFERDAWGGPYRINPITRQVFSAGPDGNAWTIGDNLPEGSGYW